MHTSRWRGAPVSSFLPLLAAVALVAVIWLAVLPSTADAQCGTQMSSCRNCHEVKGQLKVNTKGDWHVNHAFGDFCVTCHGGDAKVKDAAPAHAGMMQPVENITAACASCHPADLKTRADRYAKTLGVTAQLGSGAPAATPAGASPSAPSASLPVTSSLASAGGGCGPIGGVAAAAAGSVGATEIFTLCEMCVWRCGVTAKVKDGRIVKLDGNPQHPHSRGVLCPRGQAGLGLTYDPDGIEFPITNLLISVSSKP
ncbi:MAG: hypothetical protein Q8O07_09645 [Chloroflexota bacterium]|nr:hypothetical protein [Chloroflexota bacterium]